MNSYLEIVEAARRAFDPYRLSSGTAHMAALLHSLVRMTRPVNIVECGSGYTTVLLLAACAENAADAVEEAELLRQKTAARQPSPAWLDAGGKASAVDPGFYLKPHHPRLYCFERLASDSAYAARLRDTVEQLGLSHWFTYIQSTEFSADRLPDEAFPIDLAWNDDEGYERFFDQLWERLNPKGGLMIFHNTAGREGLWEELESIRRRASAERGLEVLTLAEPHKLTQNSCTILRRARDYVPTYRARNREAVLHDVKQVMEAVWPTKAAGVQ
jgi:predicted O-methyltransferase YrrM